MTLTFTPSAKIKEKIRALPPNPELARAAKKKRRADSMPQKKEPDNDPVENEETRYNSSFPPPSGGVGGVYYFRRWRQLLGRRSTKYNKITLPEKLAQICENNKKLKEEFLEYLKSIQRSPGTIKSYASDLDIINVYILEHCGNITFQPMKRRQWLAFQGFLSDEYGNSPASIRRLKAAASSLSNYIL